MDTSTIIFLSAFGCGLLFAGCAVLGQWAQKGVPLWKRWVTPIAVLVFCAGFGALGYLIDDGNADTTLFEIEAEGPGAQVPAEVGFDIAVEHAGTEHELLVAPEPTTASPDPAQLRVQVTDAAGRVLLDEPVALDTRCPEVAFCEWYAFSGRFTPAESGEHRLVVTVLTPEVSLLHVRVGDPLKTDGERAPGY
ncbi:hypothetical protein [Pseudonocardia humida]|uniref:Uncharacterized protein n=1 Tax=Pseudonocardia humida TaxID=2800819 RepID=A0ABT1A1Y3_9PSEU|nr:hypothetical protein [Pseudonocardia humida]MCO1657000.1 hypothetical protein [Pseudonocardia humida]